MTAPRSINEGPFCWQSKAVRRRIREAFDATNNVLTALSVYDALTEIASDGESETFETTHAWIARMSGTSVRTVQNTLKVLAEIGVVSITTAKLRAPSRYVLLTFGNGCASFGNGCLAFGNGARSPSLPTSEEQKKKIRRKGPPSAANEPDQGPDGWQQFLDANLPDSTHATGHEQHGPWHLKDKATQNQIRRLMAEAQPAQAKP